jgi:hypothetical protein
MSGTLELLRVNAAGMNDAIARQEEPAVEEAEEYGEYEEYGVDEDYVEQTVECANWKDMPKEAFEGLLARLAGGGWTRENGYEITYAPSGWCCGIDEIFVQKAGEDKPFLKFVRDIGLGEPAYSAQFFGKQWVTVLGFFNLGREEWDLWSNYPRGYEGLTWFQGTEDYVCSSNLNPYWDSAFTAIKTLFNLETFQYAPPCRIVFGPPED